MHLKIKISYHYNFIHSVHRWGFIKESIYVDKKVRNINIMRKACCYSLPSMEPLFQIFLSPYPCHLKCIYVLVTCNTEPFLCPELCDDSECFLQIIFYWRKTKLKFQKSFYAYCHVFICILFTLLTSYSEAFIFLSDCSRTVFKGKIRKNTHS